MIYKTIDRLHDWSCKRAGQKLHSEVIIELSKTSRALDKLQYEVDGIPENILQLLRDLYTSKRFLTSAPSTPGSYEEQNSVLNSFLEIASLKNIPVSEVLNQEEHEMIGEVLNTLIQTQVLTIHCDRLEQGVKGRMWDWVPDAASAVGLSPVGLVEGE